MGVAFKQGLANGRLFIGAMSYTSLFATKAWSFPSGISYLVGGYVYINYFMLSRPQFGFKEVSGAEFKATPVQYLQDPEHHRVM